MRSAHSNLLHNRNQAKRLVCKSFISKNHLNIVTQIDIWVAVTWLIDLWVIVFETSAFLNNINIPQCFIHFFLLVSCLNFMSSSKIIRRLCLWWHVHWFSFLFNIWSYQNAIFIHFRGNLFELILSFIVDFLHFDNPGNRAVKLFYSWNT